MIRAADAGRARERMVAVQLVARGISDAAVLDAMRQVPREAFLPAQLAAAAYADHPLDIGHGQTISQPYVVARTAQALVLRPGDRVLDVGTGSGYAAAVYAALGCAVWSIERVASLAVQAARCLAALGLADVQVRHGDAHVGWPEAAPFDAIGCAAAAPEVPPAWRDQLAEGGRIVLPLGDPCGVQQLARVTRVREAGGLESWRVEALEPVRYVPLLPGEA